MLQRHKTQTFNTIYIDNVDEFNDTVTIIRYNEGSAEIVIDITAPAYHGMDLAPGDWFCFSDMSVSDLMVCKVDDKHAMLRTIDMDTKSGASINGFGTSSVMSDWRELNDL